MKIILPICAVVFALLATGCKKSPPPTPLTESMGESPSTIGVPIPAPELRMPQQLSLFQQEPILFAIFDVDARGYQMQGYRALGAPTLPLALNHPVLISARNAAHQVLAQVSVPHPLLVHSIDEASHNEQQVNQGRFVIAFPQVDSIQEVEVAVMQGPQAGLTNRFSVDPLTLPPFDPNLLGTNLISVSTITNSPPI